LQILITSLRVTTISRTKPSRVNLAIGMTQRSVLVVVVFVDRSQRGVEIIHIISARKAVAYEESIYEDQFRSGQ
jgi:uncharacterized DUF497 family protein